MKITEILEYQPEIKETVDALLRVLVGGDEPISISVSDLKYLIGAPDSHLFFALDEQKRCLGMFVLGVYHTASGRKAMIEDVVVFPNQQGKGIGRALMEFAIKFARVQHVDQLMLTSRPARVAANQLYQKLGFEKRDTNFYRMNL